MHNLLNNLVATLCI